MIFKRYKLFLIGLGLTVVIGFIIINQNKTVPQFPHVESAFSPEASLQEVKDRDNYFFMLLRDPSTNKIPKSIRNRELEFARTLATKNQLNKVSSVMSLDWKEAGPYDVGGRTRALAVDLNDPNTILAGGVSGGIWKSTDKGQSWKMKSTTDQMLSVTSIAQDPREGHRNIWYYCTGEFTANSAGDQGFWASFYGNGLFKSTDGGESWKALQTTTSPDPTQWDGNFDYCSKIVVSNGGTVFVATNAIGVFRSTDEGNSFNLVLGGTNEHIFSDVVVASNGTILGTISSPFQGQTAKTAPGIYKSVNEGANWTSITPNSFPEQSSRCVLGSSQSNPNVLYALIHAGNLQNGREDTRFLKINVTNGSAEDRSANLPDFSADGGVAEKNGFYTSQGDYDMAIAVKPDDENFVLISGTCLFRSPDAFATKLTDKKNGWIGGYNEVTFGYPNFHPDIHSFAFDHTNPNSMWWGNDGGLTFTDDITNNSFADYFPWQGKNNGYNVTQFYQCSIADVPNDNRLAGGAQDNGSPFFTFDGTTISKSSDISSGDGAYAYLGKNFAYSSSQNGNVTRIKYDNSGIPDFNSGWTTVYPKNAQNQLFITPYAVDPADENIMYYPSGNTLWRNDQLESIPDFQQQGTDVGWTQLNVTVPQGYIISTVSVSKTGHTLYYGLSSYPSQNPPKPKIYRIDNANTAAGPGTEISIPNAADGGFVHNIAVNPDNPNDIVIVLSNYNVIGLYHSTNGGQTYDPIEGNLAGTQQNPGPSIRAASILRTNNGTLYIAATSIGVYSTSSLNGSNTAWAQEGANTIGNVVVNYIASRASDGKIVAATHGRGMWVANAGTSSGNAVANVSASQLNISVKPDNGGHANFQLSNTGTANLSFNITATSTLIKKAPDSGIINLMPKGIPSGYRFGTSSVVKPIASKNKNKLSSSNLMKPLADDIVLLDDGNDTPDDFLGYGDGSDFAWVNEFDISFDYALKAFSFYARSESQSTNLIYTAIMDENLTKIAEGQNYFNTSAQGDWFTINLNSELKFTSGKKFYILVESYLNFVNYPAGVDKNALVQGKSFYVSRDNTQLININTIPDFQNGAFLVRAIGTIGGGVNQPPNAIAQPSSLTAQVGENISFDASQSTDPDGQITQYLWNFGDGQTSTAITTQHSYNQANVYTATLTVTDDKGATDQAANQITITEVSGGNHLSVDPSSGNIAPGESRSIVVTFNATGLAEGTYHGQVVVNTNGGNFTLPVNIDVNTTSGVNITSETPVTFNLNQNYPNPFNPSTVIKYSIPVQQHVKIVIYDMNGKEVADLLNANQDTGTYEITWDGKNSFGAGVASGIYLYAIKTQNYSQTRKMILMK